jgi:hypothetical protein
MQSQTAGPWVTKAMMPWCAVSGGHTHVHGGRGWAGSNSGDACAPPDMPLLAGRHSSAHSAGRHDKACYCTHSRCSLVVRPAYTAAACDQPPRCMFLSHEAALLAVCVLLVGLVHVLLLPLPASAAVAAVAAVVAVCSTYSSLSVCLLRCTVCSSLEGWPSSHSATACSMKR